MTICNMTIEGGGRAGMIAPDETTFAYVEGRPGAPEDFDAAVERWRELPSDEGATFDAEVEIDAASLSPMVTWGTTPGMVTEVAAAVPDPAAVEGPGRRRERRARARLHGARARHADDRDPARPRLHRLLHQLADRGPARSPPSMVEGRKVADAVRAMVVPGSEQVREARPRRRASHDVFRAAGFEWRASGCSMCLGMNPDILIEGERCASTSNRNFEGRQGKGGRTHLVSPRMAAAAAIEGHFVDIRGLELGSDGASRRDRG